MSGRRVHRLTAVSGGDGTRTFGHRVLADDAEAFHPVALRAAVEPGTDAIALALAQLVRDRWATEAGAGGGDKVVALRGVQSECRVVNGSPDLVPDEPA
jgi:hypothetical protein